MRYLLAVLAVLAAAALTAEGLREDPGLVVIAYGGYAIRTSFAVLVAVLAVAFLAGYLLVRTLGGVLRAPRRLARWSRARRRARAERALKRGLVALAAGDPRRAERLLARSAAESDAPLLHYLAAARAADAQAAADRREIYLRRAAQERGEADPAVALARAELALDSGDQNLARALLTEAARRVPDNPRVLALLAELYRSSGAWAALLDMLPRLSRHGALGPAAVARLEAEACRGLLASVRAGGTLDAEAAWRRVPRRLHDEPELLAEHVRNLCAAGRGEDAERLLRRRLERQWDAGLAALYGEVEAGEPAAQLAAAEGWLRVRPADAGLLLALGRLSHRSGLWGKARAYLETALARRPSPEVYALLVDTLSRMGDTEAACRYSIEAMQRVLAQPGAPALPPP